MEYSSTYVMTEQGYRDRSDEKLYTSEEDTPRLIFQKYDSDEEKAFLGKYDLDLEEMNKQEEHDIYYS